MYNIYTEIMDKLKPNKIKYDSSGLIPVIASCVRTNKPLMLAYANKEALNMTLSTGYAHYFSRSRNKLWKKGETSGNLQKVVSVTLDCDGDTLLYRVQQSGFACHTGSPTCFSEEIAVFEKIPNIDIIQKNIDTIKSRAKTKVDGSYTNYLLDKGVEKICKKIGEEASESIIAAIKGDKKELANELADLTYHILVLCQSLNMDYANVLAVLESRDKV